MFDTSAYAHVIIALNQPTIKGDMEILEKNGFHVLRELEGMYKGVKENSYLIPCYNLMQYLTLLDIAKDYKQESVLYLSRESIRHNMRASIIMVDEPTKQPVTGLFRCVGMHTPNREAWTLDKELHEYYTIENIN